MQIGEINIKIPILLAPMAGVTDYPFRVLCKKHGAGVVYSEFVSAHGIIRENTRTHNMVRFSDFERPIGIQIFGDCPKVMGKAARMIVDKFNPDIVDINYGCPVPKITRRGAGSAALKDLCLMDDITTSVVEAVPEIPVTVKMRAGWDSKSIVIPKVANRLETIGVKAITLHPRTTKQSYKGNADWSLIRLLKQSTNLPVVGNGDIKSPEDVLKMFEETNCDAVMIARASLGNPWIFTQIKDLRETGDYNEVTTNSRIELCKRHYHLLKQEKNEGLCLNLTKKHYSWYLKGFPNAALWRTRFMKCQNLEEIETILDDMSNTFN